MKVEWSLNELDLMVRRATRGVGLNWGVAEEAGKATRWLCSFGFDGTRLLLNEFDEVFKKSALINVSNQVWTGQSSLLMGIALIDRVGFNLPNRIEGLKNPLFLTPFVAQRAQAEKRRLTLDWTQGAISITPSGRVSVQGDLWTYGRIHLIASDQNEAIIGHEKYYQYRASLTQDTLDYLKQLAQRTYVPDTLSNKATDAGAGILDYTHQK
jgi:hypothetical protein